MSQRVAGAVESLDIRSLKTIHTPDGIALTVELSGVPARLVAYVLDTWLALGFLLLCFGILALTAKMFSSALMVLMSQYDWHWVTSETIAVGSSLFAFCFLFVGSFLQEWLWQGRTIGKSLMKIRVVRNNAQPIGFWEAFGRNLFRIVDVFLSGVGVLVMLFSPSEKRLGDYLTGTMVIVDEPVAKRDWVRRSLHNTDSELSPRSDVADANENAGLSYEEKALLEAYTERAEKRRLSLDARQLMDVLLRQYFGWRLHAAEEDASSPDFLKRLQQGNR